MVTVYGDSSCRYYYKGIEQASLESMITRYISFYLTSDGIHTAKCPGVPNSTYAVRSGVQQQSNDGIQFELPLLRSSTLAPTTSSTAKKDIPVIILKYGLLFPYCFLRIGANIVAFMILSRHWLIAHSYRKMFIGGLNWETTDRMLSHVDAY